jgi:hypothetical protein
MPGADISVTAPGGVLVIQLTRQLVMADFATKKDAFECDVVPASLTLATDAAGKAVAVVQHERHGHARAEEVRLRPRSGVSAGWRNLGACLRLRRPTHAPELQPEPRLDADAGLGARPGRPKREPESRWALWNLGSTSGAEAAHQSLIRMQPRDSSAIQWQVLRFITPLNKHSREVKATICSYYPTLDDRRRHPLQNHADI